jgi:hypothetical protein
MQDTSGDCSSREVRLLFESYDRPAPLILLLILEFFEYILSNHGTRGSEVWARKSANKAI